MDILIKGMEMPVDCRYCRFYRKQKDGINYCHAQRTAISGGIEVLDKIRQGCPLVALPEHHGRLGDLDALKNSVADMRMEKPLRNGAKQVIEIGELFGRIIDDAPTIVEATE